MMRFRKASARMTGWHYALTPAYSNTLGLIDGSTLQLTRRERPQVLLGEDGRPTFLYNGVGAPKGQNPSTFTFAQKLG